MRRKSSRTSIPSKSPTAKNAGIEPKPRRRTKSEKPIYALDFETDPFLYGRTPSPFVAGLSSTDQFWHTWGDDCVDRICTILDVLPPGTVYAHNGGRFDFLYLLDRLRGTARLINGRIVEATIGRHTLRDSFAIIPVPLASFEKEEIDYATFERSERNKPGNRRAIVDYLRSDCLNLHRLVSDFRSRFGDRLTVAGTAIRELEKLHPVRKTNGNHDANFRRFYYGGRVQCFMHGVRRGRFRVFDVNSMYPHAMRDYQHPGSEQYRCSGTLHADDPKLTFAIINATSAGCLPIRTKDGLAFPVGRHAFLATGHEIRAGLETRSLVIHSCDAAWYCDEITNFGAFVDTWAREKIAAELAGDKAGRIFAKLILNSAYGKFGQNPEEYHDFRFRVPESEDPPPFPWELYADHGTIEVWRKPAIVRPGSYYDVAVAASITGASRAVLWRGLVGSHGCVYCDTDSLIAEKIAAPIHATRLGAWKMEAEGSRIAIAGKKTYALENENGQIVKYACKGVDITPQQIFTIAHGGSVNFYRDAPTMSVRGNSFVHRQVRMTK